MHNFKLRFKRSFDNSIKYLKEKDYQWKWKLIVVLPIIIGLLIIDVTTKQIANNNLVLNDHDAVTIMGIQLKLIYNYGVAFGTDFPYGWMITIQLTEVLIFLALIIFINSRILLVAMAFLFSGSFGNIIDRIWNDGGVVDFICWTWFGPQTIFNFADIFVTCGIVLIFVSTFWEIISFYKNKNNSEEDEIEINKDSSNKVNNFKLNKNEQDDKLEPKNNSFKKEILALNYKVKIRLRSFIFNLHRGKIGTTSF